MEDFFIDDNGYVRQYYDIDGNGEIEFSERYQIEHNLTSISFDTKINKMETSTVDENKTNCSNLKQTIGYLSLGIISMTFLYCLVPLVLKYKKGAFTSKKAFLVSLLICTPITILFMFFGNIYMIICGIMYLSIDFIILYIGHDKNKINSKHYKN